MRRSGMPLQRSRRQPGRLWRRAAWRPWLACLGLLAATDRILAAEVTYAELAPLLGEQCVACHAGAAAPFGLRLDSYDALLAGSARGPVVRAGDPASSELILRLRGTRQPRMPMTGPPYLAEAQIALFEAWIAAGLPRGAQPATPPSAPVRAGQFPAPGATVTYRDVAPIFVTRCAKCHADQGLMGPAPEGYRLTSHAATLDTAERVRVVPGRPEASELVRRIRGQARPRMPFDGPPYLDAAETELIERWIAQGARDVEGHPAPLLAGAEVRLHGTLAQRWRLDGLDLVVTGRTRLDKAPGAGDYVQVRGRLDRQGRVEAERIRRR